MAKYITKDYLTTQFKNFEGQVLDPKFLQIDKLKINGVPVTPGQDMEINIKEDN